MTSVRVVTATLDHKAADNAVEDKTVKKSLFEKRYEILNGDGGYFGVEFGVDRAVGVNFKSDFNVFHSYFFLSLRRSIFSL